MAREQKSLARTGGDHGWRHREHRSKKGRRARDWGRERLLAWRKEKGERKIGHKIKRDVNKLLKGQIKNITA